jgi:hypothetical protein
VRTQTYILLGALAAAVAAWVWSRTAAGQSAVSAVADYLGDLVNGPRGIRNNNPGNIERSNIQWQGMLTMDQVQQTGVLDQAGNVLTRTWDPIFVQSATPADGVRMIGHVLRAKAARGLTNVDSIIRDYSKTDQDTYVRNVTAALGLDPDAGGQYQTIDVTAVLPAFATAIIQQENGQQPYEPSDIANWVYS